MAKRQKKFEQDHSNDWLNTYADMVTLLLTFFVMLYASSSLDEQKWQYIYQAFQSHGKYLNEYVDSPDTNATEGDYITNEDPNYSGGSGELPQSFDQLYVYLSEYVSENDLESSISVEQGAAHINIRFNNSVFFDGNSYVLKEEGKKVLDDISPAIRAISNAVRRCTVSGHTAKGVSEINDWDLSSDRACSVVKYMEFKNTLATDQFRVEGCGPTVPIADNNTEEGRSQNRRVEMVLLKNDVDTTDPEVIKDILKYDYHLNSEDYDPSKSETDDTQKLPNDSAQAIIDSFASKFPEGTDYSNTYSDYVGPVMPGDYESFFISDSAEAAPADASAADSAAE